jgi:predicted ArsR family transcriptional regulator
VPNQEAHMPKLTDTQRVILATAARRENGAVMPLPRSLKAKDSAITAALEGLRRRGLVSEGLQNRDAKNDHEGGRPALVIPTGLHAIESLANQSLHAEPTSSSSTKKPHLRHAPRQGTKQAVLIDLLKRKSGASVEEMVAATGWQKHSVRGALSGFIQKELGLTVTSAKVKGRGRVYRLGAKS